MKMDGDFIRRSTAIWHIKSMQIPEEVHHSPKQVAAYNAGLKKAIKSLSQEDSVDVDQVVRCRDCKHFPEGMAIGMCKRDPERVIIPMRWDQYCSEGKRRDNG